MPLLRAFLLLLVTVTFASTAAAETVRVAVAANFAGAVEPLTAAFRAETGHDASVSLGSSGKLVAQIRNGAPFDVFLSADQAKPEALAASGEAVADSRFTYAVGALALWSASKDVDVNNAAALRNGDFGKLALANPRLAPYGAAAVDVLKSLGLEDSTRPHWVQGENIGQTYQFVRTGNAALGFVALSQITVDGKRPEGSAWIVPQSLYAPIRQDAILLKRGAQNPAAEAFLTFLASPAARTIIHNFGYTTE